MYRARHHYTMSDVPTFAHLRAAGRHLRAALGCLLCAVGAVLEWAAGRFDRAGSVLLGEWRPVPGHDPSEYVILDDPEFDLQWHRDPEETDTVVAPALVAVATLADCRAAFCEPVDPSPVLAPVATLASCRETFLAAATPLDQKHMVYDVWPIWRTARDRYNPPAVRKPINPISSEDKPSTLPDDPYTVPRLSMSDIDSMTHGEDGPESLSPVLVMSSAAQKTKPAGSCVVYYREPNGDYLQVDFAKRLGGNHPARSAAIEGLPSSVSSNLVSREYLGTCKRIRKSDVPAEWLRYINA